MKKINLTIKGMHCKSCEMLIKDELSDLGVKECNIDSKTGKAVIVFDESKLNFDKIKQSIQSQGYGVM